MFASRLVEWIASIGLFSVLDVPLPGQRAHQPMSAVHRLLISCFNGMLASMCAVGPVPLILQVVIPPYCDVDEVDDIIDRAFRSTEEVWGH